MKKKIISIITILLFVSSISAQSGGNYQIVQSVTGNSGETSSGGVFSLNVTGGQTLTQKSSQGLYSLASGFWFLSIAPTASSATVSGRVFSPFGRGLANAYVVMTNQKGETISTRTSSFGYYRFDEVQSGETYIVSVVSKRYQFVSQVVNVSESLDGLNFTAQ